MLLVVSGVYSLNGSFLDIAIVTGFGIAGWLMLKGGYPFLPAVLGVVLGPIVESNYRRSLLLSGDDHSIFLEDPIAIGFLVTAVIFVAFSIWRERKDARARARTKEA